MSSSFEDRLDASNNRPSGFDYLRIGLAMSIIVWHSFGVPYGMAWAAQAADIPIVKILLSFILPAFFTLSGFLVSSSLERTPSLFTFLGLRAIRIVPALGVEIALSALLLGPLLTTLPLSTYFADPKFFAYFGNALGFIHYDLPGVFEKNPIQAVNGQLWTVPWELRCYIALALFAALGMVRNGRAMVIATAAGMAALFVYLAWFRKTGIGSHNDVGVPGATLVLSFLVGVIAYRYRLSIPYRRDFFWIALIIYCGIIFIPYGPILATIPIAYMTLFLGLSNGRKTLVVKTGDYSYGIYIYGFAIQQAIVASGPWARHWYVVLPLSTLIAGCFAAFSWFVVERPSLGSRKFLPGIENRLRSSFAKLRPRILSWTDHDAREMR
jgi:peptidoglycan/LPS O-acetylase OafA/YrhL